MISNDCFDSSVRIGVVKKLCKIFAPLILLDAVIFSVNDT